MTTSYPQKPSITNYQAVTKLVDAFPVKDPSSELSADNMNRRSNDLTAVCQVTPICRFQILGTTGTPAITGSTTWTSGLALSWLSGTAISVVRNSTGNLTCTLPTTVQDFLGNLGVPINVTDVRVNVLGATPLGSAGVTINASNQFTVILNNTAVTASDFVGSFITFLVY